MFKAVSLTEKMRFADLSSFPGRIILQVEWFRSRNHKIQLPLTVHIWSLMHTQNLGPFEPNGLSNAKHRFPKTGNLEDVTHSYDSNKLFYSVNPIGS